MATTTFTPGTTITSAWLNDVNSATYTIVPSNTTATNANTASINVLNGAAGSANVGYTNAAAAVTTVQAALRTLDAESVTVRPVLYGGTGAATVGDAPFALKGANGDITSMSGLTTVSSLVSINTGQIAGLRNKIINGNFSNWQRSTSATIASGASGYPSADRWYVSNTSGISCTLSLATPTVGTEITYGRYYLSGAFTGTGVTGSIIGQKIEDVTQFSGKTITVSFYAADSVATAMTVSAVQNFGTGGSPSTAVTTTSSAITIGTALSGRLSVTFTLPSITGKTLGTNNDSYLDIQFSPTVANVHTFLLALVQVEYGSVATTFEQRPNALELALCQRYYQVAPKLRYAGYVAASQTVTIPTGWTPMRTTPTLANMVYFQTNTTGAALGTLTYMGGLFSATATAAGSFDFYNTAGSLVAEL